VANEKKRTEVLVGVFLLLGLLLLGGLIVQFGRFGDRFQNYYPLTLIVEDAAGIIKGSEIRMGGAKIGRVGSLPELTDDSHVKISLEIDDRIKLPQGSTLNVASASLLGDKMIVVIPPDQKSGDFIGHGSVIAGGGPSGFDAIQSNAESLTRDATKLMDGVSITLKKVDLAIDDISIASRHLSQTLEKVNQSILKEQNLSRVDETIASFAKTSEQFEKASAEIQPAIVDARRTIATIEKAAAGAEQTFTKVNQRIDELKPALQGIPRATQAITRVAEKASATLDKVDQGDGLLGALASDKEVSADAKAFIRNLRERGVLRYQDGAELHPADDPRNRFRGVRR
jgi:phospholipid/cholesterol/gamma-HCH transport system substrate-binding protein